MINSGEQDDDGQPTFQTVKRTCSMRRPFSKINSIAAYDKAAAKPDQFGVLRRPGIATRNDRKFGQQP
jgi:hypothetical protein